MTRPADLRAVYTAAHDELAVRVLDALPGGTSVLADFVGSAADPKAALAAVRVAGADALAPQAFGARLDPDDAQAAAQALNLFDLAAGGQSATVAWRDWGFARLLADHAGTAPPPLPAAHVVLADPGAWQPWCQAAAQLAPLSLPGLDGPVRDAVRGRPLALARGTTRALLRRDYPTAARLLRWLAALHGERVRLPLKPAPILDHLALHAGGGGRLALDLAVTRRMLDPAASPV
ncbi:hypothetical protein [Streptomyces syringium]|uniref:Uncharacterized protein n=1 Tax=Streptomyces syringium TaxID=76729 RepID=A0ABS4YD61_9ACTN|nr:hypothetical protein [Streptomyces syringium]MBP2406669.1 hypothetical protein [Streptomyces syringium]